MRIVHVTKKYPDAMGGDAVVVSHLREEQIRAGHDVTVITSRFPELRPDGGIVAVGLSDPAERLDAVNLRRLVSVAWLGVRGLWLLRRLRPDVIHSHAIELGAAVSVAARVWGVPIVHTCHDVSTGKPFVPRWKAEAERMLFRAAAFDRVFALSNDAKANLVGLGLRDVEVVRNGV